MEYHGSRIPADMIEDALKSIRKGKNWLIKETGVGRAFFYKLMAGKPPRANQGGGYLLAADDERYRSIQKVLNLGDEFIEAITKLQTGEARLRMSDSDAVEPRVSGGIREVGSLSVLGDPEHGFNILVPPNCRAVITLDGEKVTIEYKN